jgi:DNA modification methylase
MPQSYKNIYFTDFPQPVSGRASLTLAFGKDDRDIYEAARHLSSDTLRSALGFQSYSLVQQEANTQNTSVNALCLSILRKKLQSNVDSNNPYLPGFELDNTISIDPIQATFNGGRYEPLHEWYPYLEGYSPAFVETLIGHFCAGAETVLDPFSGTGTTPLTASRLGKTAFYSEINPVLQFLTASKVIALCFSERERARVAANLCELAAGFDDRLSTASKDAHLQHTYVAVFGNSVFFDSDIYADVLRCRTLIDDIGCADPDTARFLTIAVLRSLISASRLIRRGDVRFKTEKELTRGRVELREAVCKAIQTIAHDIESLSPIDQVPILLLENAKNLGRLPRLAADAVITSPPYLNGTNYFRNTKVELWFLRCLNQNEDLAKFRFRSMTVGINDVTVQKPVGEMPSSAAPIVRKLEEKGYDPRIPRMVACFASEMHTALQSLVDHMKEDGQIIIDIGDSAYAGVHVPTDRFIAESLETAGFTLTNEFVLRQRLSRSQMKLSQKLLVFGAKGRAPKTARQAASRKSYWGDNWAMFKDTLPHQQGEYAKRNWGHPLHSLCSYQGKMKPSLAAHLVKTFTSQGGRMLDPFSGVGTIPFEAALHGVESWGFDISPPAIHITGAKIGKCSTERCEKLVRQLESYIRKGAAPQADRKAAAAIRFNGALESYFDRRTFKEVLLARRYFLDKPPTDASESLVFACLLHILHGNRPYALSRRSHPITPFAPTGPTEYRALMPRLREKIKRGLATPIPENFCPGHSMFQDATEWWPAEINDLDAVITSPPFFDSTRFYLGNWMRLWFSGWEAADFKQRPMAFIDERQKRSFEVYFPILRQCRERLRTGGVAVFHLGASSKCDMAEELARIARRWFRISDIYTECVSHCESHGIRDKGTVVSHQYLILE